MKQYSVEFEYKIKEYGECTVTVEDTAQMGGAEAAEIEAEKYIKDFYPDVEDIEITGVRELHNGN